MPIKSHSGAISGCGFPMAAKGHMQAPSSASSICQGEGARYPWRQAGLAYALLAFPFAGLLGSGRRTYRMDCPSMPIRPLRKSVDLVPGHAALPEARQAAVGALGHSSGAAGGCRAWPQYARPSGRTEGSGGAIGEPVTCEGTSGVGYGE